MTMELLNLIINEAYWYLQSLDWGVVYVFGKMHIMIVLRKYFHSKTFLFFEMVMVTVTIVWYDTNAFYGYMTLCKLWSYI